MSNYPSLRGTTAERREEEQCLQSVKEGEAEKKSTVTELQHYGNLIFSSLLQNLILGVLLIISHAESGKTKEIILIGWSSKVKL